MATNNKYRVYFKCFGEKKRMDVEAIDKYEAEQIVMDKIEIIYTKLIEGHEKPREKFEMPDQFKDIFKGF